ncbi:MAG: tetratricopeptide repeat protein [Candidatus Aureabacteria bacterium]|nr:tetratricopeptide repeat protein [Candidatus Auribacterota bacterium]
MKKLTTLLLVIGMMLVSSPLMAANVNFGDGSTKTLTAGAWASLQTKDYDAVMAYTDKCISTFSSKALEQQASLTGFAPADEADQYWALNDVAACLFIKGKALREQGKLKEAKKAFESIISNYGYAQCFDSGGWFWKLAEGAEDEILGMEKGVDFGNYNSETLTVKSWGALESAEYEKAIIYTDKCLALYGKTANDMQSTLNDFPAKEKAFDYWALNDVATCLFIKGKALQSLNKPEEAKKVFNQIISDYSFAQCWDSNGFFWSVAQGAKDQLTNIELGVDFGNMTSETLISRAWESLGAGKYRDVEIYVNKCLEIYGEKAREMQASLSDYAEDGKEFDYWALNDVGTCLFILGRAYYIQGKNEEAKKTFNEIIEKYTYAQSWDPQGWFWRPSEGAKDQILLMETGIDFGDYTSQTLTAKAWQALGAGDLDEVLVYCRKCVQLYKKYADEMQAKLNAYAPKEKAFDYWALNDVGTCYFIMGEAYLGKNDYKKALEAYKMLVDKYFYSQCWDSKGWFWKPAVAARGKINKIAAEKGLM